MFQIYIFCFCVIRFHKVTSTNVLKSGFYFLDQNSSKIKCIFFYIILMINKLLIIKFKYFEIKL